MKRLQNSRHEFKQDHKSTDIDDTIGGSSAEYAPKHDLPLIEQLGRRIITHDLEALLEGAQELALAPNPAERHKRMQRYIELVLSTRTAIADDAALDAQLLIAASNALSILNYGNLCGLFDFQFCHVHDWSSIRAPHANLNMAILTNCCFDRADLSHASFYLANLTLSSFKEANLEHATMYSSQDIQCDANVRDVAIAPNAQSFAALCENRHIYLYHIDSRAKFNLDATAISFAYSPDSSYLASGGSDGEVRIWSVASGACVAEFQIVKQGLFRFFQRADHDVTALSFAATDSRLLAVGSSHGVIGIWRIPGDEVAESQAPVCIRSVALDSQTPVEHLSLSSSRPLLAAAYSGVMIDAWDLSTHSPQLKFTLKTTKSIDKLAWSLDGSHLAAFTCVPEVWFWDSARGDCVEHLAGPFTFKIAGERIKAFVQSTSLCVKPLQHQIEDATLSLNALCKEHGICIWNILPSCTWTNPDGLPRWFNLESIIAAVSSDGRRMVEIIGGTGSRGLRVSDTRKVVWISTLYRHTMEAGNPGAGHAPSPYLDLSPDGQTIVSSSSLRVDFWDSLEGKLLSSTTFEEGLQLSLQARGYQSLEEAYKAFFSDGNNGNDEFPSLWHLSNASRRDPNRFLDRLTLDQIDELGKAGRGRYGGYKLSFASDGKTVLLSGGEGVNYVIEAPSGRLKHVLESSLHPDQGVLYFGEVTFSELLSDSPYVKVYGFPCQDVCSSVQICDLKTRRYVYGDDLRHYQYAYAHVLSLNGRYVFRLRVTPRGAAEISLQRLANRSRVARARAPEGSFMASPGEMITTKVSPSGHQIVVRLRDTALGIFDVTQLRSKRRTTRLTCKRLNHKDFIVDSFWIARGQFILTVTENGLIHIWDPTTCVCIRKFDLSHQISAVKISSSRDLRPTVVTVGLDRLVRVWRAEFTWLATPAESGSRHETSLLRLVRVMGRSSQTTAIASIGQQGAVLTHAWKI